jgi:hypothetical protein
MSVCLGISSFRSDDSVLRLLDRASNEGALDMFDRVIVVDSLGTGKMPESLRRHYGARIEYHCADRNLGSAGNLARRLELAAAGPQTCMYAVNHDGHVERSTVATLLKLATQTPGFGAIYPLRRLTHRAGTYDITGTSRVLLPARTAKSVPAKSLLRASWSSSNPALYSLSPIRDGIAPWADLWMGWEDLGYGWWLAKHGYPQFISTEAITEDGYESRPIIGGRAHISVKPAWYAYYSARNLVLITRRVRPGVARSLSVAGRVALDLALTVLLRDDKRSRLRYIQAGLYDGFHGRSGKWVEP